MKRSESSRLWRYFCVPTRYLDGVFMHYISRRQPLFVHLEAQEKELLVRTMYPVVYKAGDMIFKQGEDGAVLYFIDHGDVVCLNHESGSDVEEPAHTYRPDDLFGELAMLYNAPRTATCCAASDCRLYALDRKAYKFILMKTSIQRQSQNKALLQNVDILKQLTETELLEMSDAMLEVAYENGDVVCRQGDMGSNFYIIKQGAVTCTQLDAQGNQLEVAHLMAGDYFGEIAFFKSKPRQATVVATKNIGTLRLLTLDRSTFNRIFGSIEDILRRDMAAYNKFWSAQI